MSLQRVDSDSGSEPRVLQCTHCSASIGNFEAATGGYQLHKPYLSVGIQSDQGPVSYPMAKWLACQILAAVESQGVRKFTIRSRETKSAKTFKIWVLTPNLTVSSSAAPSSEPIRTMKVLWHTTDEEDENESEMRKFLTESQLELQTSEAEELLRTLQSTCQWIPECARELQGWHIGLLERFTAEDLTQWKADTSIR